MSTKDKVADAKGSIVSAKVFVVDAIETFADTKGTIASTIATFVETKNTFSDAIGTLSSTKRTFVSNSCTLASTIEQLSPAPGPSPSIHDFASLPNVTNRETRNEIMSTNTKQTVTSRPIVKLDLPTVVAVLIDMSQAVVKALTGNAEGH